MKHGTTTIKNFINLLRYLFIDGRNNDYVCHADATTCSETTSSFTNDRKYASTRLKNCWNTTTTAPAENIKEKDTAKNAKEGAEKSEEIVG